MDWTWGPTSRSAAARREARGDVQLWAALKDLRHGPAQRSRLMFAAQAGDVPRLRWLLELGAQLELEDSAGRTALHWASAAGRTGTVHELLERGALADAAMDCGTRPLFAACENGHLGVVCTFNRGFSPLFAASKQGHIEIVRELLEHGAEVDCEMMDSSTALLAACESNHLEVVTELLDWGARVDGLDLYPGLTPLRSASEDGSAEIVQLLITRGATVNPLDWQDNPLVIASMFCRLDIVQVLLDGGATLAAATHAEYSPLYYASTTPHPDLAIVQELLARGGSASFEALRFALDEAQKNGLHDIAAALTAALEEGGQED